MQSVAAQLWQAVQTIGAVATFSGESVTVSECIANEAQSCIVPL